MSRGILKVSKDIFVLPIRTLRHRIGEIEGAVVSQEEMARRIGCTHAAYRKWEVGTTPGGEWMLRILALCPDEETRAAFFLDIGEVGSKIRSTPRREVPKEDVEARRPGAMRPDGTIVRSHKVPRKSR